MKLYKNPEIELQHELTKRPIFLQEDLREKVANIMELVQSNGDAALYDYAKTYDNVELNSLFVSSEEILLACSKVEDDLKNAIQLAADNISKFHSSQLNQEEKVETTSGVFCWRNSVAIEKVGLYIPGGTAPLFSTVLMLGIPAKIAGCKEIVLCTPPNKAGQVNPTILYTANLLGIQKIYKVGGAQAIAAMCFGTETIPKAYKIFGPGNQYVTKAKELALQHNVSTDMPAGPSEVLVIADKTSIPEFVAADLLSQAEHGVDSQVVLLSTDEQIVTKTMQEVALQVEDLPRKEIISKALKRSFSIIFNSIEECIKFSNLYAPEHLIIASEEADRYVHLIINAGSVFLGNYSCESAGDYASGTNHTLPTNGYAKQYSGVSVDSFIKKITFQKLSREGINTIGPAIELMAEAEGLEAHKNAVSIRLKK